MELLTASRLSTYRKCARREWFAYREGWRPIVDGDALLDGTLWHRGMEAWWLAWAAGEDALAAALAAVAGRARDEWAQVRIEEMLRGYDARWKDQRFDQVIGVEEEFRAPLVNPDTFAPSRTWRLAGKVDVNVIENGRALIVEHKTSSEDISPGSDYWLRLQMDHQLSIYTIGAEVLGHQPAGCLYDVAYKPQLKPLTATPEAERKYTQAKVDKKTGEVIEPSRLYANQRATDETVDEYRARVRAAITAEPDKYFQRREVPRIESQLKDFLWDAWETSKTLREGHLAGRAPRSPESCFNMGRCPYWQCCSTGSRPEDHPGMFHKLEWVHPELTPEEDRGEEKYESDHIGS